MKKRTAGGESRKKRILIAGKYPPPYFGTTVWFKSLKEAKWFDEFEMLWFDNNIHQSMTTVGTSSIKNIFLNIELYRSFRKAIRKHRPDLVLIPVSQSTLGFIKDSIFVRIAKKYSDTLLILHGANWLNWLQASSALTNGYVRNTLKHTKGIIVLGEKIRTLFTTFYAEENIFVVPNGITVSLDSVSKTKKEQDSVFNITYLGNLIPAKGILEVIEALTYLQEKNLQLNVIGQWMDADTKEYCEDLVRSKHLPVTFKGPLYGDNKLSELLTADLFIFTPNKPEGHPLVIVEALAAGLPVISTDQGAITESVIDNVNGFIVETNNPKQIAEKIEMLMSDPELLKKMGAASRKLYEEKFTSERMVKNFERVFTSVLK